MVLSRLRALLGAADLKLSPDNVSSRGTCICIRIAFWATARNSRLELSVYNAELSVARTILESSPPRNTEHGRTLR